jgi:hypothetical protein
VTSLQRNAGVIDSRLTHGSGDDRRHAVDGDGRDRTRLIREPAIEEHIPINPTRPEKEAKELPDTT